MRVMAISSSGIYSSTKPVPFFSLVVPIFGRCRYLISSLLRNGAHQSSVIVKLLGLSVNCQQCVGV